jgi:hypothetical protein
MSDINVTVTNAGSSNVTATSSSTYTATVGNGGSVNVAVGTVSPGNATVVAGTLAINSTTTLAPGSSAYVKNVGTAYAASLDIGIPSGNASTVQVGSTTTLDSGNASVTGTTNGSTLTLAFAIPRGAAGANGTNGTNGTTPTFTASASTLSAGSSATVTTTTTNGGANVALAFGIPQGAAGSGGGSNLTLSDATPSALGTAAAGSSTSASRSDHTHALPSLSTLGAAAANHSHSYVTALNNLTGGLTLAAGSNVTLTANGSTLTIDSTASGGSLGENASIDGGNYTGVIVQAGTITIVTQPQSTTATDSQVKTAAFSVVVASYSTPSYQWQVSTDTGSTWANISNATTSTLSLTGLISTDNGNRYRVVVSATGAASATSNGATLTVSGGTIQITSQPSNQTSSNRSAQFSVTATVTPSGTLSYQWQKSESGTTSWANVSGATNAILSLSDLLRASDNGDKYRVVVSAENAYSVTSSEVTLTVPVPRIVISSQPTNQTASGGVATLSVTAAPDEPAALRYDWQTSSDSGQTWTSLFDINAVTPNAGSPSLQLSGLSDSLDNGTYYRVVIFSNTVGPGVISSAAMLTVAQSGMGSLRITQQPFSQTITQDSGSVTFSVTTSTTGGSPSYQWQRSSDGVTWANITGGTASSLTQNGLTVSDYGTRYRVIVGLNGQNVTSREAYVAVLYSISITQQPANQTASNGTATFRISAVPQNSASPYYIWEKSTDNAVTWMTAQEGTSNTLNLTGLTQSSNGNKYRATVYVYGSLYQPVTSNTVTLTVS